MVSDCVGRKGRYEENAPHPQPLSSGEGSTAGAAHNYLMQTHRPKLSPVFSPRYPIRLSTIHGW